MAHEFGSYGEIGWVEPPGGWLGSARAAVSLRGGGTSAPPFESLNLGRSAGDQPDLVSENERRFAAALRHQGPCAKARLEHGIRLLTVDEPGTYGPYDGLVTSKRGLPVWLTVADCFPLFVTVGDWIGLMHCGWKGTAQHGAGQLVEALAAVSGIPRAEQRAWIGPGVGACCYPVGEDVAARFPAGSIRRDGETMRLDLAAAIRIDLQAAGVTPAQIAACELCTSCRPDLFFSYRRDGARSGRMAAVISR